MRAIIHVLGVLVLLTSAASAAKLSWQGLGLVRLGMTVEEAQRGLKASLTPKEAGERDECWVTRRADGQDESVYYEVRNGKITAITVDPTLRKGATTNITDTRGLGVGATEADLREAYGDLKIRYAPGYSKESEVAAAAERTRLAIKLSKPELSPEWWVEVDSPNHERTIIYDTRDSKVLWLRTGLKPWVTETECKPTSSANSAELSWQGLGLVRLGMTVEEAQRGLRVPLTPKTAVDRDECWVTRRADGKDESVYYDVRDGKITAITVDPTLGKGATTNITDTRGLGIGATEADIRGAYGDVKIRYAPDYSKESEIAAAAERARLGIKLSQPEPSPEWWVEVDSPDHERTIIFNTRDSKVLWFRTGLKPWATELECN